MKSIQLGALLAGTIYIAGCATDPEIHEPPCSSPAVLDGNYHQSTPGYLVSVQDSVTDIEALVHELAAKHAFKAAGIMSTVKIFSVKELTPGTLAALRCEPTIGAISFNEPTRIGHVRYNKPFEFARTARPTRNSDALLLAAQPRR